MNRRRVFVAATVLAMLVALAGLNRAEPDAEPTATQPYPKVLAELRPEGWPETLPTMKNAAVVEQHLDGESSWVLVSPGDYLTTAMSTFDSFVAAGYAGTRLISLSDSTYLGEGKGGDAVAVRLDTLAHPKAPAGWTVIRVTYVEPPQEVDQADLEKLA